MCLPSKSNATMCQWIVMSMYLFNNRIMYVPTGFSEGKLNIQLLFYLTKSRRKVLQQYLYDMHDFNARNLRTVVSTRLIVLALNVCRRNVPYNIPL